MHIFTQKPNQFQHHASFKAKRSGAMLSAKNNEQNAVSKSHQANSNNIAIPRFAHDFSRIPVHTKKAPVKIQTKLAISSAGDIYEQEADSIAEKVLNMSEPQVQRACACRGECSKCQAEESGQEHKRLQTKRIGASKTEQTEVPPIVRQVLDSPGQPLDSTTRNFVEPRFGYDFSGVRIHSDSRSAQSARSINALAYTVGNNIVFNEGQYQPSTSNGRKLLVHELTHVVQQGGGLINGSSSEARILRQPITDTIQRYPGCSAQQDRDINQALTRARRRSTRAIQAITDLQSGTSTRAAGYLRRYFGTLSPTQINTVRTRMEAADARLHNAAVWRCDTAATYVPCRQCDTPAARPNCDWCAGTDCPTINEPTHLCPVVFRPESEHACAEPSRAILLEHEALRAAGACGGFHPPGARTPPDSLDNVYSYSNFMYGIASGDR